MKFPHLVVLTHSLLCEMRNVFETCDTTFLKSLSEFFKRREMTGHMAVASLSNANEK